MQKGPAVPVPFLLCIQLSPNLAPKSERVLGMHEGAVVSFRSLWESQCSVSAVQDAKGSVGGVVHQFHSHIILVLHHSRIFLQPLSV